MSKKSIDDVLKKIEENRKQDLSKKIKLEEELSLKRESNRQRYLMFNRIFENSAVSNLSPSSSNSGKTRLVDGIFVSTSDPSWSDISGVYLRIDEINCLELIDAVYVEKNQGDSGIIYYPDGPNRYYNPLDNRDDEFTRENENSIWFFGSIPGESFQLEEHPWDCAYNGIYLKRQVRAGDIYQCGLVRYRLRGYENESKFSYSYTIFFDTDSNQWKIFSSNESERLNSGSESPEKPWDVNWSLFAPIVTRQVNTRD